jgi:lysozyme
MPPFGYQPTPTPVARFPGGESDEKDVSGEKDMSDAGRNLQDRGLADDEIDLLLANDIALAHRICSQHFGTAFETASWRRQAALISMAFNLGAPRLAGFRQMHRAILEGDWQRASAEALDSCWARQTGHRAQEVAAMLRRG